MKRRCVITGMGAVSPNGVGRAAFADADSRGQFIAALGAARVAAHDPDSISNLKPTYVRAPEAVIRAAAGGNHVDMEALWSGEKKISSFSTLLTTKS